MKNYIYQFTFEINIENYQEIGLKFSSEMNEENSVQGFCSPVFAFKYNDNNELLFPGELDGNYKEFEIRKSKKRNEFYLDISEFGLSNYTKSIVFKRLVYLEDFDVYDLYEYQEYFFSRHGYLKYMGSNEKYIKKEDLFEIIVPTDLIYLDELYRKHKFCLVGFTPIFNNE
ncbi:MAG TPA: hypothetical protein VK169_00530 [Saprospiraceae bacterium]|nr:hypothetical protein [Saprospiraceae bacterium]